MTDWHKIQYEDYGDDGGKFIGELPQCDPKTGEVEVILTYQEYHFENRNTSNEIMKIDGRKVGIAVFREAYASMPDRFVTHIHPSAIIAWAYPPEPYME